jgi:glutamate--cysteine ligase
MSSDVERPSPLIGSADELCQILRAGEKPDALRRVGAEHEKLPFFESSLEPAGYDNGIRPLLSALTRFGWLPEPDEEQPVALARGRASITLEPGGQLELSGAPARDMHEVARELSEHIAELMEAAEPLGLRCASLGTRPRESAASAPWMPKPRYAVMRDYLPQRGRRALEMMLLTATVQANFDYSSEADMTAKMRTAMAVSPVMAALSASSPYRLGRWSGYRSWRNAIWREVDPDRCGLLPFVFDDDFSYRRYVDWALDVPMIFLRRQGAYRPAAGITFRRFWREGQNGERATLADFENHLSTLFPDVRLRQTIEVRSADACPPPYALGLVALWKGLLYDREARRDAFALTAGLSFADRQAMQLAAAQDGLRGHGRLWHLGELARALLGIARSGLKRQARHDGLGRDESLYLEPLEELVQSGETLADRLLARFGPGPLDATALRQLLLSFACERWSAQRPVFTVQPSAKLAPP